MKGKQHMTVCNHAALRAAQRHISRSTFWDVERHTDRINLKSTLVDQHKKLAPMLRSKKIDLKVGKALYKVSVEEISTRVEVNGTTYAVGIRRVGDDYTPLSCITAWN